MAIKEECGDNIALCEIYFSYQYKDEKGNMCFQDLIENGNDILVTKDNFDLYVEKRIEFFTKSPVRLAIALCFRSFVIHSLAFM